MSAQRRVQPLGGAAAGQGGVGLELAGLPDQDLLVVPADPDADVGERREAVGLLDEEVLADRLDGVHDLGEAVVVVGRLDEHLVVAPGRRRRAGHAGIVDQHRELHRGEQAAAADPSARARDARRVARDEARVGRLLAGVVAAGGQIDVDEAAVGEPARRRGRNPRVSGRGDGPAPGGGGSRRRSGPSSRRRASSRMPGWAPASSARRRRSCRRCEPRGGGAR